MTDNKMHLSWDEYLPIGLAVAIYITYLDISRDHFFLLIAPVVFFLVCGFKDNLQKAGVFLRKCWWFVVIAAMYMGYYKFLNYNADSLKFVLASLGTVFAGYMISVGGANIENAYKKMWILLLPVIALGIIRMAFNKTGYFVSTQVELEAVLILITVTLLFMEDISQKIIGCIVSAIAAAMLLKRGAFSFHNALFLKDTLAPFLAGSKKEILFGRGIMASRYALPDSCDNTFSSLLYDFGAVAFILYLGVFIFAIVIAIRYKDALTRKSALLVMIIIVGSAFNAMEHWTNIIFLIYTGIGILSGRVTKIIISM